MKLTKVAQVCQISQMLAIIVHQDTLLETAIRHTVDNPHVRGIFLVDDADKLVGVVNSHDLLLWVRIHLGMAPLKNTVSAGKLRRLLFAERILDLARAGSQFAAVQMDTSLADVLDVMSQYDLVDIPVLDENGRIVNDLRLSEVLAFTLNQTSQE